MRNDLAAETKFLTKQARKGYVLTRISGSRYYFARQAQPLTVRIELTSAQSDQLTGDFVVAHPLRRGLVYNAIYTQAVTPSPTHDGQAMDNYHRYMLNMGTAQEWKAGVGLFFAIILILLQQIIGHEGGNWLGRVPILIMGGLLFLASLWGLFIGMRNSLGSAHAQSDAAK